MLKKFLLVPFILFSLFGFSNTTEITPRDVTNIMSNIMKNHVSHKKLTPIIIRRTLTNFLDSIDPAKTYLIEEDISQWLNPSPELIDSISFDFQNNKFDVFKEIQKKMIFAIQRRKSMEEKISNSINDEVNITEFKDISWAKDIDELLLRLKKIKAMQVTSIEKLEEQDKDKTVARINKARKNFEENITNTNKRNNNLYYLILKSMSNALDSQTNYFTPEEATQFLIGVQQRLFGIGVQLRDDASGFSITKIIEGGPAFNSKQLKINDRIIAVDGEPVVGMDIIDAVQLIRGKSDTPVILTIMRETEDCKKQDKLDITLMRGEVVLSEKRIDSWYEPFGDGVIGVVSLFAFYQDPNNSSADDMHNIISELKEKHNVKGIILDLRNNMGGLLAQAVDVTGLFINKGIIVSVKDSSGKIKHLRDMDGETIWDGPLIVLISKVSASAAEIVAQTLQDYGRAIIVGDEHSYGKGTFQSFTLNPSQKSKVNPKGEYKVTKGRYYTVSGKSPQLTGVLSRCCCARNNV